MQQLLCPSVETLLPFRQDPMLACYYWLILLLTMSLSPRVSEPSLKLKENMAAHQEVIDRFWDAVKDVKDVSPEDYATKTAEIHAAYGAVRTALGVVPHNIKSAADRAESLLKADGQASVHSTRSRHSDANSLHSARSRRSDGSHRSSSSRHSGISTSSSQRRALIMAEKAALEIQHKAQLEESERLLDMKALEHKHELELEKMKREMESRKLQTEIQIRDAELAALGRELSHMENSTHIVRQNKDDDGMATLTKTFAESLAVARMPTPEPSIFTGDPLSYPTWKASFEALIHQKNIPACEKILYLQRYLGGPAKEAVAGVFLFDTEEAYRDARKTLDDRYGNPFTIAEAFRTKLDDWPRVKDGQGLRKFSDFLQQCKMAMRTIEDLQVLNDCRENRRMLKKLPDWAVVRWSRIVAEKTSGYPDFAAFSDFVRKESEIACNPITSLEKLKEDTKGSASNKDRRSVKRTEGAHAHEARTQAHEARTQSSEVCLHCQGKHNLAECVSFRALTATQRREMILKKGLCFGCLSSGHKSGSCRKRKHCKTCKGKHPTCLCGDYNELFPKRADTESGKQKTETESGSSMTVTHTVHGSRGNATTMIVPVYVSCDGPREVLVYALLDTQSDATFVQEDLGVNLGAPSIDVSLKLSTMNNTSTRDVKKFQGLKIRRPDSDVSLELPAAYAMEEIPITRGHIPSAETAQEWEHLRHLETDMMPLQPIDVGLLVGVNCPQALTPLNVVHGQPGEPYAVETPLGWSIIGGMSREAEETQSVSHRIVSRETETLEGPTTVNFVHKTAVKEVLATDIVRALEDDLSAGVGSDKHLSQEEMKFVKVLEEQIHLSEDGFYEMPLPFKEEKPKLPNNRHMAEKRLENLRRKFDRDDKYFSDYRNFVQDILDHDEAEEVPDEEINSEHVWYIPHHGVYHPKKPNKIRVVFDCSAQHKGTSLNQHLLQGPDQMSNLTGLLCRFRNSPVAFTCDVERMFHQFRVNKEDRDFLRFLWWKDSDPRGPVRTYRMKVHLFGATSSPGCAIFGMRQIAQDQAEEFSPEAINFITQDFYMDDGLQSTEEVAEAISIVKEAREICRNGKLRLHKFTSNSKPVLDSIPQSERAQTNLRDLTQEWSVERTLGLQWCLELDQFQFRVILKDLPLTRRSILSTVASIFDPLGLIAPFVLVGRQVLQQICKENVGWDDPVPEHLASQWMKWRADLCHLEEFKIDRCFKPDDFGEVIHSEIHHFSDASLQGYGACSYIRLVNKEGAVHCSLIMGKSRVAPKKVMTVPRMELCSALLSVKIAEFLRTELRLECEEYFWSDSKITLGYVTNRTKRFHIFVANRVQQISDSTSPDQWRHVKSEDNPADCASRGVDLKTLADSKWIKGPDFLWRETLPPRDPTPVILTDDDPEVKRTTVSLHTSSETLAGLVERIERFSDWFQAKKAVSNCFKFMSACKSGVTPPGGHTVETLKHAEHVIIKAAQQESFREELQALRRSKAVPEKSTIYKLDPFLDQGGILRVGGRLAKSYMTIDEKHPVILPRKGHVTALVIRYCHEETKHQGRGITVNAIRSRGFWIIGCSSAVSHYISKCVTCRKLRSRVTEQKMADLPKDRLTEAAPFTYCAVDCFGPFLIKKRRTEVKRYGVLFTCLASRAVHIEVADSLTTDSFICSLRRLVCLRGPIRLLRSDQGTNFVGAKSQLKDAAQEMDVDRIREFLLQKGCDIEFQMNVPSASHMGGIWERQIGTARRVLEGLLSTNGTQLDDESLRTYMYEVTAIINSRPLTTDPLSDQDLRPLTPNDLLTTKTDVVMPLPGIFPKEDLYAKKHWRRVQYLSNQFWNRWRHEYLQILQSRQKWNEHRRDIQVGDVVILKDEDLPRGSWRIARVEDTTPSEDGHVRKVTLRLAGSQMLERPVQKLVVLLKREEQ